MSPQKIQALVVEPQQHLAQPYSFLQKRCQLQHYSAVKPALQALSNQQFDLFILSASFQPAQTVKLLEAFKNQFKDQVVPLIIVIDLSQALSAVPGTQWAGKLDILHSQSSEQQTLRCLDKLMSA